MELSIQIKKYRTELHLSQEELAEKVYVTRQTISNWENEKSYPDIHSLLLLSSLFNVSLDQLIKGDIEKMKEIISEQEIKKFNYYGSIYTVHLAVLIISAVPLFMWLGRYAYIRKRQIMRQSLNSTPPVMGGAASGIRPEDYLTMA